jgi:alkylation response protein AidB-like acyl-CoA dehydrogenase
MDLTTTAEQELLIQTARRWAAKDGAADWDGIAALGWTELGVLDLVLVAEELGRALVASPLLVSCAAARLLERDGNDDARERWVPALRRGSATATVAVHPELVPWAAEVDVVVHGRGQVLAGPSCVRRQALSDEPVYSVGGATAAVADDLAVTDLGYVIGAAEQALALSVQHANDREQFGRPIGSFQAVAHRCVDMRADIDACRYLAWQAAWALDARGDAPLEVAAALAFGVEAMRRVFVHAHQVHGAIGFSTEYPLHRHTRRAKAFELTWGPASRHREAVAGAMGL